jgi:hypothetical protein
MKTKLVYELFIAFALFSCRMTDQPETGYWRAALVPDSTRPALEIPFRMEITGQLTNRL